MPVFIATAAAAVSPPTEPDHEFSFVVLGDSQFHQPNAFNRIIDQVAHLYPSFVLQVGDMISGYVDSDDAFRAQWQRFQAQIAPLGEIPFLPVAGNHDLYDADRLPGGEGIYREIWGDTYYAFDYQNAHFVVLNSDEGGISDIEGEQLAWLERDLARAKNKEHIFVFFHRPIYTLKNHEILHQLFVEHDVSAVLYGHFHHSNYHERDGIPYVMTVSAANVMETDFPHGAGNFHHLLFVTVRDNAFRIAAIKSDSVLPPDLVAPEDNQYLYGLYRGFFSEKQAVFEQLKRDGDIYRVELRVNNPSAQELAVYFEWQLPNERWEVEPLKGKRVVLRPGAKDHVVRFALRRKYAHPPEAFPTCTARALYLTSDGDVVQSEHEFAVVSGESER